MEHGEAEASPLKRRNLNVNNQQNSRINLSSQEASKRADAALEGSLRGEDTVKYPLETEDEPKDFLRPKEALQNSLVDQGASQSSANLKDTAKEHLSSRDVVITSEEEEFTGERAEQPEGSSDLFYAEAVKTEVSYHHMIRIVLNIYSMRPVNG
jgi:hypothetical protein